MSRWINLLSLLPNTLLTILVISIAFLRFYDQTDFTLLGYLAHPRTWSNRLTVAALLVAVVNLGVEWNRRNRETDRLVQAEAQRIAEEQRRIAEAERATRRARIEAERDLALLNFLVDPSPHNREVLMQVITLLAQYRQNL
ncbi:hypothetical protein [Thermosynechococcus vestitus]|uniref:Tlr0630 protein n=1 Tax=Thermosynechococcus vestitus (strain NIES-2133 / IAM M-273 / BP-1) TaxID=197221 RepID=Q8DL67_THEVB|nr:hypothetical protein [Thermosynechococcus vestitus]BAC08181.1 tlr0630 [Thermosynechococcus vestitus BP-1]